MQKALHDVEYDVIYLSTGASDKSWILLFQTLATHTHSCILYRPMEDAEVAAQFAVALTYEGPIDTLPYTPPACQVWNRSSEPLASI